MSVEIQLRMKLLSAEQTAWEFVLPGEGHSILLFYIGPIKLFFKGKVNLMTKYVYSYKEYQYAWWN